MIRGRIIMHEFGVAKSLVETVENAAVENHATSVSEVVVDIGELAFIGIDQLKFAYGLLIQESNILKNAKLTVHEIPARVLCKNCGYEGPLSRFDEPESHFVTPVFACPECFGKIDFISGRECTIKNIRMMVDDDVQVK